MTWSRVTSRLRHVLLPVVRSEVTASVLITGRTQAEVWSFIRPAETSPLTDPHAIRGFTVPGTGPGVGERQCTVALINGQEISIFLTIVHEIPPVLAETVSDGVHLPTGWSAGSRFELSDAAGGTCYRMTSWLDVPRSCAVLADRSLEARQAHLDAHVGLVKSHLDRPATAPQIRHGNVGLIPPTNSQGLAP